MSLEVIHEFTPCENNILKLCNFGVFAFWSLIAFSLKRLVKLSLLVHQWVGRATQLTDVQ